MRNDCLDVPGRLAATRLDLTAPVLAVVTIVVGVPVTNAYFSYDVSLFSRVTFIAFVALTTLFAISRARRPLSSQNLSPDPR